MAVPTRKRPANRILRVSRLDIILIRATANSIEQLNSHAAPAYYVRRSTLSNTFRSSRSALINCAQAINNLQGNPINRSRKKAHHRREDHTCSSAWREGVALPDVASVAT